MLKFAHTESLNGFWTYAFFPDEEPDENRIFRADFNELAAVPGCFDAGARLGMRGTGVYRRTFTGRGMLQLRFEGLGLRARIWVGDRKLGTIDAPFTPYEFTFDAGETEHEMTLTVAVTNLFDESAGSLFHEFYDFYGFGGLYRGVTLRRLAGNGVETIMVTPLDVRNGRFRVRTDFLKATETPLRLTLDGKPLTELSVCGTSAEWEGEVAGLAPWTPETPCLHTIAVETPFDRAETDFGLRTLDWRNGELSLNGVPLKLRGLCRHDSHPQFGYAMPESLVLSDLRAIREAGCNFIRGSHYMQSDFLLDCCDRMGLLFWEESCAWGNTAEQCASEAFRRAQLDETRRMVLRHYNHPAVILWGVLNECDSTCPAGREILRQLFAELHRLDATRPATFATYREKKDIALDLCDVISFNTYPGWYDSPMVADGTPNVKRHLKELEELVSAPSLIGKPWIVSEIGAAAMAGDHSGFRWSEEYQEKILNEVLDYLDASPRCTGMSWWLFANVNTYLGAPTIIARPRGFNNKGLLTEYRQPKLAWRTLCRRLNRR